MILKSFLLNHLMNSGISNSFHSIIDHFETFVENKGDSKNPLYEINVHIYLKQKPINSFELFLNQISLENSDIIIDKKNMNLNLPFVENFDPNYLVDKYMFDLLIIFNVKRDQVIKTDYTVFDENGNII